MAAFVALFSCGISSGSSTDLPSPAIVTSLPPLADGTSHGASVEVSGDLAVVGRPGNGETSDPAVDVYRRVARPATLEGLPWEWIPLCQLVPAEAAAGNRFGSAVAIDGSTVVVGAYHDDRDGLNAGAVWVFDIPQSPPAILTSDVRLVPMGVRGGDYLGWDVDIDGDVLVAGAWGVDVVNDGDHAGAAWIFERTNGHWTESARVTAGSDVTSAAGFGTAVAVEQGHVLIGTAGDGPVHHYTRNEGFWNLASTIPVPGGVSGTGFGSALAWPPTLDGETPPGLLIGAPRDGQLGQQAGAAWRYDLVDGIVDLDSAHKLTATAGGPWQRLGTSVAATVRMFDGEGQEIHGGITLLGGPGYLGNGGSATPGGVYVLHDDEDGQSGWVAIPEQAESACGAAIAIGVGSVPDWGYPTVTILVGSPAHSIGAGHARIIDVPDGPQGGDCNDDDRFDAMEVLLDPESADCDGDGTHDACQLSHDEQLDCDGSGRLDVCEMQDDPTADCDEDGVLDTCQLDFGSDCNGDAVLDVCQLDAGSDCDGSGVLDVCELNGGSDCDGDGLLDHCQLSVATDCDGNGMLDTCELHPGSDCDGDGVLDVCQVGTASDCDANGTPDVCELNAGSDCDGNGHLDVCDVNGHPEWDCDNNGVLDVCESGPADDCDKNGVLDRCELVGAPGLDCDGSGVLDVCEVNPATDCDGNGVLDVCDAFGDPEADCDASGVLDVCELGPDTDCDGNGILDACELADDPSADCNGNGVLDDCEATTFDCNGNGVPDDCDIASDPEGLDCDGNGHLDVCQIAADPGLDCDEDGVLDVCVTGGATMSPDWMTEQFQNGTDLNYLGIRLSPTGAPSGPAWQLCTVQDYEVWLDPIEHDSLQLADDESVLVSLPFPFEFAGEVWSEVYVGSNGYVTFGTPDATFTESLSGHFSLPRLSVLFDDLDPSAGGEVRTGIGPAGSFVVTWIDVPLFEQTSTMNTVQLVLHPDHNIEMSWPMVMSESAIAGPSDGEGIPSQFVETDLSNAFDCVARPASVEGDCNVNGMLDVCEADPVGLPWWGTEHFVGDFDLSYTMVRLEPQNLIDQPEWLVCAADVSALPFDASAHTVVPLGDEDSYQWPVGFDFPFGYSTWDHVFINSNGHLTFGMGDSSHDPSLQNHFAIPRISGLLSDLDPAAGGAVRVGTGPAGSLIVTWEDVPFYGGYPAGDVDMQVLLHPDGVVEMAWLDVQPAACVVGASMGVLPYDFAQTDLSANQSGCVPVHAYDDCDGSGVHDGIEIALGCLYDMDYNGIPDDCEGHYISGATGPCPYDVTDDQIVDVRDLLEVLYHWGQVKPGSSARRYDFEPDKRDNLVDGQDLLSMIHAMRVGCQQ